MPRRDAGPGLGLALAVLACAATAQTIYRCDDGRGGVLYADAPCKDGAKVDVLPGKADPAAIERMKREEKAFGERHAAREEKAQAEAQASRDAREARARAERQAERDRQQSEYAGYPGYAWGGYWPWPPVVPTPPRPPRPRETPAPHVPAKAGMGLPVPPPAAPRR